MEILEKFSTANSKEEIMRCLTARCRELEFDYFIYTPLLAAGREEKVFKDESKIFDADALVAQNTLFTYPESWAYRYQEAQHLQRDPIIRHLSKSMLPIFWDDAEKRNPENVVLDEAREHGLGFGITVSLYGHGGKRAVLSLARSAGGMETAARRTEVAAQAQLTAHYVHEALWQLGDHDNLVMSSALSVREKDCLQWAAVGKTSWEIARILMISERTVVFHLSNAAKKLGATNRRQAVVRALTLRVINP